jgi:RHS repeat-associated protein
VNSSGGWNRGEVYAGGTHLATYNDGTTYFIHHDWLGTERVRSNVPGVACETITSLPFGDGMSTTGSCSDISPMHFTGKQRDTETSLDNFDFRYNSPNFGRFMSADDTNADDHEGNPQGLNLYSYVQNDPMNSTDPDGHDCVFTQGNNAFVKLGDCSGVSNGTYVPGTVDPHSGIYNPDTHTLTFSYEPYSTPLSELFGPATIRQYSGTLSNVYPTHPGQTESEKFASALAGGADNVNAFALQVGIQAATGGGRLLIGALIESASAISLLAERPDWARTAGGFLNWLKNLQRASRSLSTEEADAIASEAKNLGIKVRLDPPHPGTNWDIPHLNIGNNGQVHLQVPQGYTNPTIPQGHP